MSKTMKKSGIIPVCTGSTRIGSCQPWPHTDHPRMHGEHEFIPAPVEQAFGSSPYARGAQSPRRSDDHGGGIIPVCTGSTLLAHHLETPNRDHPRMHGEHRYAGRTRRVVTGSSPYARGALRGRQMGHLLRRIIPVCTGSTLEKAGPAIDVGIIPVCTGSTSWMP